MSFITEAEAQAKIKIIAEQIDEPLNTEQVEIVNNNVVNSYNKLMFRLTNIGYNKTQIDSWASGETYQMDICIYLTLIDFLATSVGVDQEMIDRYNVLDGDLAEDDILLLDENGDVIRPDNPDGESQPGLAISPIF